jgi:hypothetical protein
MSYSLENLWNFSDDEIKQILRYFKHQMFNNNNDRLNAVILSFNNNLLVPEDKQYVLSPYFNQLFLSTDDQLRVSAQERGLSHIGMIKYIINNLNTSPSIPNVNSIPNTNQPLALYQMGNNLYLCGSGTFKIRDQLKALNGIWNPNYKCWSFPLEARNNLLMFVTPPIPTNIVNVNYIPEKIPNNLQVYQMNGKVLLCGNRTYNLQDRLRAINGKFDKDVGCWVFPPEQANSVINIYNESQEEESLKAQRTQELRQMTREENKAKAEQKARENAERQIRMRIFEPEAKYIPHIDRLPSITKEDKNSTLPYTMQEEDIKELKPLWDDKIQILTGSGGYTRGNDYIATYIGDTKPPNLAFALKANGWNVIPFFGYSVKRIDYKKYNIHVSGTD